MSGSKTHTSAESLSSSTTSQKPSYWAHMVSHYEKRNASLEQRQSELSERIRLMECAVPSLLMGAMVSMKRNVDPIAKLSSSPRSNDHQASPPEVRDSRDSRRNKPERTRCGNGRSELSRFCKNTDFRP